MKLTSVKLPLGVANERKHNVSGILDIAVTPEMCVGATDSVSPTYTLDMEVDFLATDGLSVSLDESWLDVIINNPNAPVTVSVNILHRTEGDTPETVDDFVLSVDVTKIYDAIFSNSNPLDPISLILNLAGTNFTSISTIAGGERVIIGRAKRMKGHISNFSIDLDEFGLPEEKYGTVVTPIPTVPLI